MKIENVKKLGDNWFDLKFDDDFFNGEYLVEKIGENEYGNPIFNIFYGDSDLTRGDELYNIVDAYFCSNSELFN